MEGGHRGEERWELVSGAKLSINCSVHEVGVGVGGNMCLNGGHFRVLCVFH